MKQLFNYFILFCFLSSTWYLECDQVSAGDVGLLSEYIDTDSEKEQPSLMQALDLYYLINKSQYHAQETYYLEGVV